MKNTPTNNSMQPESITEETGSSIVDRLVSEFNKNMSGSSMTPLDVKSVGMSVWTRGDGTRYRDPGQIRLNPYGTESFNEKWKPQEPVKQFWKWLITQPGVTSIGQVSGELSSSEMRSAVKYKNLYFAMTPGSIIEWGSVSRYKNPKSVWTQQKDEAVSVAEDEFTPQSALGKALWTHSGRVSQTEAKGVVDKIIKKIVHGPSRRAQAYEKGKDAAIDYITGAGPGGKELSDKERRQAGRNAERYHKVAKPGFHHSLDFRNITKEIEVGEAKGVVDKNFGKVRKNDVVQTDLNPGDLVIGHTSPSTSVFGKVKRIGREHIFMLSNSGEEIAFLPQEIELLTKDYWLKKLDAESARRAKFRKESVELDEWANVVQGDMVNHHLLPKGGKVLKVSGNSVFVQDNATQKVLKLSILSLLRGNDMTEADQAQITNVQPGKSATVQTTADNNGVSQTMQIDLQKNPAALRKNPQTGKLELSLPQQNQQNQQNKGQQGTIGTQGTQGTSQSSLAQEPIKTGDKVDLTQMNDLKKLAGL